jgi:hypothetical protein
MRDRLSSTSLDQHWKLDTRNSVDSARYRSRMTDRLRLCFTRLAASIRLRVLMQTIAELRNGHCRMTFKDHQHTIQASSLLNAIPSHAIFLHPYAN